MSLLSPAGAGERVVLVAEDDWYPYSAKRNGQAEGLAVDIVRAAFAAAGVTVEFKTMPYARCMQAVRQGVELGCFDTLKDASTRDDYLFHEQPLFKATIAIYAPAAFAGSVNAQQLAGHSVGLTNGYTYGNEVEQDTRMLKDKAVSDLASLRKLVAGRLDYALVYTRVADQLQREYGHELSGRLFRVGTVIENPLFVSFSRHNLRSESARFQLDRGLQRLQQSGQYQQILQQWQAAP